MMQICGGSASRKLSQCLVCKRMNGLIAGLLGNVRKLLKNFLCTMHFQFREHTISSFLTPLDSLPALHSPPHSPNIFTFHILLIRVYTMMTTYFVLNQVGFCDVQLFAFPEDWSCWCALYTHQSVFSASTSRSRCGPPHPPLLSPAALASGACTAISPRFLCSSSGFLGSASSRFFNCSTCSLVVPWKGVCCSSFSGF